MLDNIPLSSTTTEGTENSHQGNCGQPNEEILKMQIHQNPKCIQIGNYYSCFPYFYRRSKAPELALSLKDKILVHNNLSVPLFNYDDVAARNRDYARMLGIRFNDRFSKINYALWVGKDAVQIHRFCQVGQILSAGLVFRFHAYRKLIDIALANNESHLVPAILFFGTGVNQLKTGLGSQLWKTLCNNSFSRNRLIFLNAYRCGKFPDTMGVSTYSTAILKKPKLFNNTPEKYKPIIENLSLLPTSILKSIIFQKRTFRFETGTTHSNFLFCTQLFLRISTTAKKQRKLTDESFIDQAWQLIIDTYRMARRLNEPFSLDWSERRIHREHNRLSHEYTKLLYPNHLTEYQFTMPWVRVIGRDGITASLLTTPHSLAVEGSEMHHCVASYHDYVYSGHSIIFSLKDQHNVRSTLELGHEENKVVILQHRGKYNDDVSPLFDAMAQHVVDIQNALLTEKRLNSRSTPSEFIGG